MRQPRVLGGGIPSNAYLTFKDATFSPPLNLHTRILLVKQLSSCTVFGLNILAHINFIFYREYLRVYRCATLAF